MEARERTRVSVGDRVIYCALARDGHYRARVTALRGKDNVDIEVDDVAIGKPALPLFYVTVVPSLRGLIPGTCAPAVD